MHVRVNQPRKKKRSGEIQNLRSAQHFLRHGRVRKHGPDALAVDNDIHCLARRCARPVDQDGIAEYGDGTRCWRDEWGGCCCVCHGTPSQNQERSQ